MSDAPRLIRTRGWGWAWRFEDGHLGHWAEPERALLVKDGKPSPGAVAVRVSIVELSETAGSKLVDQWRKSWHHPVFTEGPLDEEQTDLAARIDAALARERERCARVVESWRTMRGLETAAENMAADIRENRTLPDDEEQKG